MQWWAQCLVGVVAMGLGWVVFEAVRCKLGFHPPGEVRMRTGEWTKTGALVSEWYCGRCMQPAGETEICA